MPSSTATEPSTYLIIGSGVFGASTALALIRRNPLSKVTLIDREFPNKESASWDWTKVIRADYRDILYARLALEAKEAWRKDSMYSEFYHETGIIWVDGAGFSKDVVANYSELGADEKWRMIPVQELRNLYDDLFRDADFGDHETIYLNESSGYAEASKALKKVIIAATSAGVRLLEADISSLMFDKSGNCLGARSKEGLEVLAEHTILATGAETAKLLVESAPEVPEYHAGTRLLAAGLITGRIRLEPEEAAHYRGGPAFLHAGGPSQGIIQSRHFVTR
jgi:sarcosine oxidase / L-pipecolate oxidase